MWGALLAAALLAGAGDPDGGLDAGVGGPELTGSIAMRYEAHLRPLDRTAIERSETLQLRIRSSFPEAASLYIRRHAPEERVQVLTTLMRSRLRLDEARAREIAESFRDASLQVEQGALILRATRERAAVSSADGVTPLMLGRATLDGETLEVTLTAPGHPEGGSTEIALTLADARVLSSEPLPALDRGDGSITWRVDGPRELRVSARPELPLVPQWRLQRMAALVSLWAQFLAFAGAAWFLQEKWRRRRTVLPKAQARAWWIIVVALSVHSVSGLVDWKRNAYGWFYIALYCALCFLAWVWVVRPRGHQRWLLLVPFVPLAFGLVARTPEEGLPFALTSGLLTPLVLLTVVFILLQIPLELVRQLGAELEGPPRTLAERLRIPARALWLLAVILIADLLLHEVQDWHLRSTLAPLLRGEAPDLAAVSDWALQLRGLFLQFIFIAAAWMRPLAYVAVWAGFLARVAQLRRPTFGEDAEPALFSGALLFGFAAANVGELPTLPFVVLLLALATLFVTTANRQVDAWLEQMSSANAEPDLDEHPERLSHEMIRRVNSVERLRRLWRKAAERFTDGDLSEPEYAAKCEVFVAEENRLFMGDPPEAPPPRLRKVPEGVYWRAFALGMGPGGGPWQAGVIALRFMRWWLLVPVVAYGSAIVRRLGEGKTLYFWNVSTGIFWEAAFWVAVAWLFGAFYPYLRGRNGLLKAFFLAGLYAIASSAVWLLGHWLGIPTVPFPLARSLELLIFVAYLGVRLDIEALSQAQVNWYHLIQQYRLGDARNLVGYLAPLGVAFYAVVQHILSGDATKAINAALENANKLLPTLQ